MRLVNGAALAGAAIVSAVAIALVGPGGSTPVGPMPSATTSAAVTTSPTSTPPPSPATSPSPSTTAPATPPEPATEPGHFPYEDELAAYLETRRGSVSVSMRRGPDQPMMTYTKGDEKYITASTVKIAVMATVMVQAQAKKRALTSTEKKRITSMIRISDNDATTALWRSVGRGAAVLATMKKMGATGSAAHPSGSWGRTSTIPADQVRIIDHFTHPNDILSEENRKFGLSLLTSVSTSQDWGVTVGHDHGDIAVKNGWLPRVDGWHVASVGSVVEGAPLPFTIAVYTHATKSTQAAQIETIEEVTRIIVRGEGGTVPPPKPSTTTRN